MVFTKRLIKIGILLLFVAQVAWSQPDAQPEALPDKNADATSATTIDQDTDKKTGSGATAPNRKTLFSDPELASQQRWLTVGNKQLQVFFVQEVKLGTYGGVLLIPDLHRTATTPGAINSLRNALPESHWHTLALDFAGTNNTLNEMELIQSIVAGVDFLNEQGIFNIAIIAEGSGAPYAINYLEQLTSARSPKLKSMRVLMLINASNSIDGSDKETLQRLGALKLPIVDAFYANDTTQKRLTKLRKRALYKTKGQNQYQQITLPPNLNYRLSYENRLTKRLRGWMDKNISGFTIDRN